MAGNRTLKLSLLADDKQFQTGLGKAESRMSKFGGALKTTGKVVAGVGAAAVGLGVAAFGAASKLASSADKIAKTSAKLGVSTDAYQEMAYWASQNGLAQDQLDRSVGRLNQRIGRAIDGNDKYAAAFEGLGVSLTDTNGQLRDTEHVMADTVARLSEIEDPALRSAAASEVFGTKMARDLMPALEDGALSLEDAAAKAHELGIVLDEDAVAAGEKFSDSVDNIKRALGGMLTTALTPLVGFFADRVLPVIETKVIPAMQAFGQIAGPWLSDRLDSLVAFMRNPVMPILRTLYDRFMTEVLPALQRFGAFVTGTVIPTVRELAAMFVARALPAIRSLSEFFTGTLVPAIRSIVVPVIEGLRRAWQSITDAIGDRNGGTGEGLSKLLALLRTVAEFVGTYVAPVVGQVLGGAFQVLGQIIGGLIRVVDRLLGGLGRVIDAGSRAVDTVKGLGGRVADGARSLIPGRATGGVVQRGRPYMVGEFGPELFVPSGGGSITPANRSGGGGVTINVTGTMLDPEGVARAVDDAMRRSSRRVGAAR